MADSDLADIAKTLSSLYLALVSCLIAKGHCLIEAEPEDLDNVEQELQLATRELFGLSSSSIQCHPDITLEDFGQELLIASEGYDNVTPHGTTHTQQRTSAYSIQKPVSEKQYTIVNVIVIKNLSLASHQIQIQALELIRTGRIFTHNTMHSVPKPFLTVILNSAISEPMSVHLTDRLLLSHYHSPEEELSRLTTIDSPSKKQPRVPYSQLQDSQARLLKITLTTEIRSYLISLSITLRTHRFLRPGSSTPAATKDLETLSRCLALLNGLDYVSPELIAIAARKVYRHRLRVLRPEDAAWERSVMYGSSVITVKQVLERLWTTEDGQEKMEIEVADGILNEVLGIVEVPV